MFLITVYGGSVAVIGDKQLSAWQHLYKYVDVENEIKKMDSKGVFIKMTANGTYKKINKSLYFKNQKIKKLREL